MRRLPRRAASALVVAAVGLGLTLGPASPGQADDTPTGAPAATAGTDPTDQAALDAAMAKVRGELAESSDAMILAAANLELADAALPGARATAARAQSLLAEARRRQEQTAQRRGEAQVRYMLSTQQAEQSASEVVAQQAQIGRLARAVYQGGGTLGNVSMLLEATSPSDFAERLVALQTVVGAQRSALDRLQTVQRSFGSQTDDLAQVRDELASADKQAQRDLQAVAQLSTQADQAVSRVGSLMAARKAALAAAQAASQQEDVAQAQQAGTSSSLQSQLSAIARRDLGPAGERNGADVPPVASTLGWPARGPITSPFGMRVHPITGVYKLHTGTDFGIACGTPVHAALPGTVIAAGWDTAYGWRTVITHGVVNGVVLTTTYNHQSQLGVAVGDQVAEGQVIGLSGTTGFSTGCHLHFELYVNSTVVDAEPWLPPH
jgi:murein DD-endopeptidase MepM/ murein hydrolase activator NlpD